MAIKKLTEEDRLKIKELYSTGEYNYTTLGKVYNCSSVTIHDIVELTEEEYKAKVEQNRLRRKEKRDAIKKDPVEHQKMKQKYKEQNIQKYIHIKERLKTDEEFRKKKKEQQRINHANWRKNHTDYYKKYYRNKKIESRLNAWRSCQ